MLMHLGAGNSLIHSTREKATLSGWRIGRLAWGSQANIRGVCIPLWCFEGTALVENQLSTGASGHQSTEDPHDMHGVLIPELDLLSSCAASSLIRLQMCQVVPRLHAFALRGPAQSLI
jgi:hypothetical protein